MSFGSKPTYKQVMGAIALTAASFGAESRAKAQTPLTPAPPSGSSYPNPAHNAPVISDLFIDDYISRLYPPSEPPEVKPDPADNSRALKAHGVAASEGSVEQRFRALDRLYDLRPEIQSPRSERDEFLIKKMLLQVPSVHSHTSWKRPEFVKQLAVLNKALEINFRSYGLAGPYKAFTENSSDFDSAGDIIIARVPWVFTPKEKQQGDNLIKLYENLESLNKDFPGSAGVEAAVIATRQAVHTLANEQRSMLYALREYVAVSEIPYAEKTDILLLLHNPERFKLSSAEDSFSPKAKVYNTTGEKVFANALKADFILSVFNANRAVDQIVHDIGRQAASLIPEEKGKLRRAIQEKKDLFSEDLRTAVVNGTDPSPIATPGVHTVDPAAPVVTPPPTTPPPTATPPVSTPPAAADPGSTPASTPTPATSVTPFGVGIDAPGGADTEE